MKPKFQINNLVRVADLGKTFSKGAMTNGFYTLYKITEINNDKIPSYHIDNLSERYNEASLKKTELTTQENKDVMEKVFITQIKSKWRLPSELMLTIYHIFIQCHHRY